MSSRYLLILPLLLLCFALLAGCAVPQSLWGRDAGGFGGPAPITEASTPTHAALQQFSRVQAWPAEQFVESLPALEQAYARQPLMRHRLALAVTLGVGDCADCDRERALALFRESEAETDDRAVQALVGMFVELLQAQAQLDARGTALARQQREMEALQQKLQEQRHKLEALTSIEESLHRRD